MRPVGVAERPAPCAPWVPFLAASNHVPNQNASCCLPSGVCSAVSLLLQATEMWVHHIKWRQENDVDDVLVVGPIRQHG